MTKTGGKLLLGGKFSVTNSPTTGQVFIYNHISQVGTWEKPLITASTADYSLSVNIKGTTFVAFQSRRMYAYTYS